MANLEGASPEGFLRGDIRPEGTLLQDDAAMGRQEAEGRNEEPREAAILSRALRAGRLRRALLCILRV